MKTAQDVMARGVLAVSALAALVAPGCALAKQAVEQATSTEGLTTLAGATTGYFVGKNNGNAALGAGLGAGAGWLLGKGITSAKQESEMSAKIQTCRQEGTPQIVDLPNGYMSLTREKVNGPIADIKFTEFAADGKQLDSHVAAYGPPKK